MVYSLSRKSESIINLESHDLMKVKNFVVKHPKNVQGHTRIRNPQARNHFGKSLMSHTMRAWAQLETRTKH